MRFPTCSSARRSALGRVVALASLLATSLASATPFLGPVHVPLAPPTPLYGVRYLEPTTFDPRHPPKVLVVLSPLPGDDTSLGDPLDIIRGAGLQDTYNVVVAYAWITDGYEPWYANNPAHAVIHQDTSVTVELVADIEARYAGRANVANLMVMGFSKSGVGACALMLRHPGEFTACAAWDSPLEMDPWDQFQSGPVYGTYTNFFENYSIWAQLARQQHALRGERARMVLLSGHFPAFTQQTHDTWALLDGLGIAYVGADVNTDADGALLSHAWHLEWIEPALRALDAITSPIVAQPLTPVRH